MTPERWAQQIIEKELGCPVIVHDDGSQPGMYDLRIGDAEAPDVAIECVRAVDAVGTETWNVGPGKGPLHLTGVERNWLITISRDARIDKIEQRLGPLLRDLEERGIRRVSEGILNRNHDCILQDELEDLGIHNASCLRMPGTGKVHWSMEGNGGVIATEGIALPGWIEEFLLHPDRKDVLSKLGRTSAQERWVFVPVMFGGAPWSVESYLMDEFEHLPAANPNLPPPVTGVWVTSTFRPHGVRWDGVGWRLFRAKDEPDAL